LILLTQNKKSIYSTLILGSEFNTYIENLIKKKDKDKNFTFWKLDDDQLKAVRGICLTFGVLFIIGVFANFTTI